MHCFYLALLLLLLLKKKTQMNLVLMKAPVTLHWKTTLSLFRCVSNMDGETITSSYQWLVQLPFLFNPHFSCWDCQQGYHLEQVMMVVLWCRHPSVTNWTEMANKQPSCWSLIFACAVADPHTILYRNAIFSFSSDVWLAITMYWAHAGKLWNIML